MERKKEIRNRKKIYINIKIRYLKEETNTMPTSDSKIYAKFCFFY